MAGFALDKEQVSKAVSALSQYLKKKNTDNFLDEPEPIFLQLCFNKVPKVKNKIIKIPVTHSLHRDNEAVCLFVKDVNKKERDPEPTIRHYREVLDKAGITAVSEIIPVKMLKTEYKPFEAKRNLSNMYDVFLADKSIMELLPEQLGKAFYGRKKFPVAVNMKATDLKGELQKALDVTRCIIGGRGSSCATKVAHSAQTEVQVQENVMTAAERLSESIPGGSSNVKTLHLKAGNSPALPIYASLGVEHRVHLDQKRKMVKLDEPEDVTTVEEGKVQVLPSGNINVILEDESQTPQKPERKKRRGGTLHTLVKRRQEYRKEKRALKQSKKANVDSNTEVMDEASDDDETSVPTTPPVKRRRYSAKGRKNS